MVVMSQCQLPGFDGCTKLYRIYLWEKYTKEFRGDETPATISQMVPQKYLFTLFLQLFCKYDIISTTH